MSDARSYLADWFEGFWGEKLPEGGATDLFERFGIDGDDADEFMESFASRFEVDAENFLWYFHFRDEAANPGALLFKPIYKRVKRIPITPDMLVEAIETKQWPVVYPPHEVPTVRWDVRVSQLVFVIPVVALALLLWLGIVA
ncbi:MAG: DUF1493 family protein [Caulobacter sp.]|nr:DUF1493 family protein [Caulobacter sp.]